MILILVILSVASKSIKKYFDKIPLVYCESHTFNQYDKNDDDPNFIYQYMTSNGYQLFNSSIGSADHFYKRVV